MIHTRWLSVRCGTVHGDKEQMVEYKIDNQVKERMREEPQMVRQTEAQRGSDLL